MRYTNSVPQIEDGNGKPIVGAKKYFFQQGTTTIKTIYSDSALTIATENPAVSDENGRFPNIFLDGLYKEVQEDAGGVTLWTRDPVGEISQGPFDLWDTSVTYNIPDIVQGSDDNYYRSLVDSNTGSDPILGLGNWEELRLGRVWESGVTYGSGDSVYGSDGFLYTSKTASNTGNNPTTSFANWTGQAPFRGCLAYSSIALDYTTSVKELLWDSEFYDTDGIHSTSSNTGRLTVPAGVTKIKLTYCNQYTAAGASNYSTIRIYKNGVSNYFLDHAVTQTGVGPSFFGSTPAFIVSPGDYFQLYLQAQSGTMVLSTNDPNTSFGMEIIE